MNRKQNDGNQWNHFQNGTHQMDTNIYDVDDA